MADVSYHSSEEQCVAAIDKFEFLTRKVLDLNDLNCAARLSNKHLS